VRRGLGRRGVALERPAPRQELVGDDRERVTVARGRDLLAERLLRGEVAGRSDDRPCRRVRVEPGGARDSEVGDLQLAVLVQQQVRRLHVAVHDAGGVRGVERRRGLREPGERAAGRLRALRGEPVGERAAGEELHHDVRPALVLADVEDRGRARRVRQPCGGERLVREAAADPGVVRVRIGEHLHRDHTLEHRVLGAVDHAHAAARDELRVAVAGREDALGLHRVSPARAL
jgi:hypothetical protein